MARYLSQAWIDDVNETAGNSPALKEATAGVHLTLQQVVTDTPHGEVRYWLHIDDGSFEAGLGNAKDINVVREPDATVAQSYEAAKAVIQGTLSTEEAFLAGRIRLRGDITVLLGHQAVLNRLGESFEDVRQRTEYP